MKARLPKIIFQSFLSNKGKEARLRRKLIVNKENNWLLAVMLHSFAKIGSPEQMTDLEKSIVDAFRRNHIDENRLKEHGRFYQEMPAQLRNQLFPGKFAQFAPQKKYTLADMQTDAPTIVSSVLKMPNVTKVDVQAIHEGNAHIADFISPRNAVTEHASELFIASTPNSPTQHVVSKYTIKANSFRCNRESSWDGWTDSDEPYWIFGSLGNGVCVTTRSPWYEDVDSGESRTFEAIDGCIWGPNCQSAAFPDGEIATLVSLWEYDCGDPSDVKNGVAAAFAAASGVLAASGVAAWVGAVVSGVGKVIDWLLGFLDDDHIADQTIVFTRQSVVDQLGKNGPYHSQGYFDIARRFTDGDSDYTLKVRVSGVS